MRMILLFIQLLATLKAFSSIQSTLFRIADYLKDRGLNFSPSKSCWMLFTRSKATTNFPSLKIYDTIVPKVDSVRFLGITMDSKMTGREHIKFLVSKGAIIVDILTALAGTWWGSHPQLLLNLYRSIFRGAIEYGCHIFRFNQNKMIFNKLERLQFRAIRIAMGYRISTPINVMLYEAKEIPLKLRFISCMCKFLTKSLARKFNPVIDSPESMKNIPCNRKMRIYLIQSFPIFRQYLFIHHYRNIVYSIPFLPYFFCDYDTATLEILPCMDMYPVDRDLSNEAINKIFLDKSASYSTDAFTFYTDGSKTNKGNPSGASVYSPDINLNFDHRLPAETSVFTAEVWAIYLAVNTIIGLKRDKAVIFTDSKSVLEAIASSLTQNKNYLIHYIRKYWLNCIYSGIKLYIFWIPSHKGIRGNEIADSLAKKATLQGYKPNFKVPFSDLFAEVKESLNNQFISYLNDAAQTKGVLHASLYQNLNSKLPWYHDKPFNRKEIVLVNRLRSNHYNLNYSLYRKNIVPSAVCQCGDPRQDINHIFYCPNTVMKSQRLRAHLRENYPNHAIDIFPILKDPDPKLIRLLLSYLQSNDILI